MGKSNSPWPTWKIALVVAGCVAGSVALFWLSAIAAPSQPDNDEEQKMTLITVPAFLQILGATVGILALLAAAWLVYRIRLDRIPVWERKKPRKRRKRRR